MAGCPTKSTRVEVMNIKKWKVDPTHCLLGVTRSRVQDKETNSNVTLSLRRLRRFFHLSEQLRSGDSKRLAETHEHIDRRRLLVIFQHADVRTIYVGRKGQFFLRQTSPHPSLS